MIYKHTLIAAVALVTVAVSCSKSNTQSSDSTTGDDSVVMAVDTAKALPDAVQLSADGTPMLDSLASAEATLQFMKNSGHWDAYQAGIIPSVMEQSLDYARRLLRNQHEYFIIVDKQSMTVNLYDKYGREKKSYLMACSKYYGTKHKRRDNRTPEGFFSAAGIFDSTDWLYTNDDGYTSPARGQFGPRFIRLKTPVTSQVGIHGTAARHSPGHRASHGCIRIQNEQILELVKYASTGMPIIVNPSDRDRKVNESEGVHVTQLNLGKGVYAGGTYGLTGTPGPGKKATANADSAKVTKETETEQEVKEVTTQEVKETEKPEPKPEPTPAPVPESPAD